MAQERQYSFLHFNEKDGFPEKYIYSICQDQRGTVWLGTGTGLYLYTGKKFKKINSPADRPNHQIGNILQHVFSDLDGKLWLSSLNAIQSYDPVTNRFAAVNYGDKRIQNLLRDQVGGFCRDKKGNLWVATRKNYWYLFESSKKQIIKRCAPFHHQLTEDSKIINKLLVLPNGKMAALSSNGLFIFSNANEIACHFHSKGNNAFLDGYYDATNNCIWMAGGYSGIVRFDLKQKEFSNHPIVSSNSHVTEFVTLVAPKNKNEIWFGATILGIYQLKTKQHQSFQIQYEKPHSFLKTPLSRLVMDRENNLWLASFNGLSLLPWQNQQIFNLDLSNPWAGYTVQSFGIIERKKKLYVANNTSNGLMVWDQKSKNWSLVENPFFKNDRKKLKGIWSLVKMENGAFYANSEDHLFRYFPEKNILEPLIYEDQPPLSQLGKLIGYQDNHLFVSSRGNGFYHILFKEKIMRHFTPKDIDPSNPECSNLTPKWVDKQGNVYFTKTSGIYSFAIHSGEFKHLATEKAKNNGAFIQQSIDLVQNSPNSFWITTHDKGVFHYFKTKKGAWELINYNQSNSRLPSDYCQEIRVDKNGMLWIGTLNGLCKFNPKTASVSSVIGQAQGLRENAVIVPMDLQENGDLIISFYGGISIINTLKYKTNKALPSVLFTDIRVQEVSRDLQTFLSEKPTLSHEENFIRFEFYTPLYNNSDQNIFHYRLRGLESEWKTTSENEISYLKLPPGDYHFELKIQNNDGYFGPISSLHFIIQSPFYQTIWFYLLLFCIIGTIIYGFYRFKTLQIRKEESLKSAFVQQIAEIKMKALRSQMNPHFIFNSLNSIQRYILEKDTFHSSQYLTKFSKLMRMILDHSNQDFIPLEKEMAFLQLYVEIEQLRFEGRFEAVFKVETNVDASQILVPSMIFQPYIENAIWHGLLHKKEQGYIHFYVEKEEIDQILVTIEDNGIGREKAKELKSKESSLNKSFGMKLTEERIALLNHHQNEHTRIKIDDLKNETGEGLGTRIQLWIPIQNKKNDTNDTN